MKLSEAIRLGAKLRPQAYGDYFRPNKDGQLCSCALGAAYEAVTGRTSPENPNWLITDELERYFPTLKNGSHGIIDMNDIEQLTREQIATQLEEMGL